MKIIETKEGSPVVGAFKRALPVFGIEENMPLILVNADADILDSHKEMEEIIDEIEADKERPIIFYSFDNQERLEMRGHPASRLFYRSDVGFVKMPVELVEIKKLYDILVSGKKIANPAAEAYFGIKVKKNLAGTLLHDFNHNKIKVMEKAQKEFGIAGTEEEVMAQLESLRRDGRGGDFAENWKGRIFPGVFCDIEETLFVEERLNESVLEKLKKYAETKPATLWSGGDLEEIKKKLVVSGVFYPLVSKHPFKGCAVEIILDDLSQGYFEEKYKIYSREYIQVKS